MKEFHDVRRQPRLMLSLVGGPLLVLAAFGATFRSANPYIRTILVWPENGIPGISQEQAVDFIGQNFTVVKVTSDKAEAMQMLQNGDADTVTVDNSYFPMPKPGSARSLLVRRILSIGSSWRRRPTRRSPKAARSCPV